MYDYVVTAKVELFPQEGGWFFIRVPNEISDQLQRFANRGLIPIEAKTGNTVFKTSLMPYGDGTKFIALKASVRKKESIGLGDEISVIFRAV